MKNFLLELVKDGKGNVSSARVLNVTVGFCACLISWKLVIMGGYSPEYFYALLAYGAGVYGTGKWNETKSEATEQPPKE